MCDPMEGPVMALQQVMPGRHPAVFAILATAVVVLAMLALTAIFGVGGQGPSLDFIPDPGLGLPF